MADGAYPVSYEIDRPREYNRWTVAFRIILAIPQLLLVGGGSYGLYSNSGVLNAVLAVLVLFAWFAILFTARYPVSMRNFCMFVFRWSQNVRAYMLLQAAPYPPFSDGPYPLRLEVQPDDVHNRLTVFFRVFLGIPHIIALAVLGVAQGVVTLIAWFAILFTGHYPTGMFDFSVSVSRWSARVEAYLYLFVDEYPPFSLASQPGAGSVQSEPA